MGLVDVFAIFTEDIFLFIFLDALGIFEGVGDQHGVEDGVDTNEVKSDNVSNHAFSSEENS